MKNELIVESRNIQSFTVAYEVYTPDEKENDQFLGINKVFEDLKQQVDKLGFEVGELRVIGIPVTSETGLIRYECCVEIPDSSEVSLDTKTIPGGAYAVLVMDKKPEVIGPSIDRFWSEYVTKNAVRIDGERPVMEMYTPEKMEYFVPILP